MCPKQGPRRTVLAVAMRLLASWVRNAFLLRGFCLLKAVGPIGGGAACWSPPDFTAEICCDLAFGPFGNESCWDRFFSFETCCGGTITSASTSVVAVPAPPPPSTSCEDVWRQLSRLSRLLGWRRSCSAAQLLNATRHIAAAAVYLEYKEIRQAESALVSYILDHEALDLHEASAVLTTALAKHPDCLKKTRWQLETVGPGPGSMGPLTAYTVPLCAANHFSMAVQRLKVGGFWRRAREVFAEATTLQLEGGQRPVPWSTFGATPRILAVGLRSQPFWQRDPAIRKLVALLRRHWGPLLEELRGLLSSGRFPRGVDAYQDLKRQGTWGALPLYSCIGGLKASKCALAPVACKMLEVALRDGLFLRDPRYCLNPEFERAGYLSLEPNTSIPWHSDTNGRLNIHVGLQGTEGAWLSVGEEAPVPWRDGEVLAFQDSFDHYARHEGGQTRFVFFITVAHPDWASALEATYPARRVLPSKSDNKLLASSFPNATYFLQFSAGPEAVRAFRDTRPLPAMAGSPGAF